MQEHCPSVGNDRLASRNPVVESSRLRLFAAEADIGNGTDGGESAVA
jgi:hypothetical protein